MQMFKRIAAVALVAAAVGCATSDPGVTTAVKSKLAADDTVKAYQIDVDTQGGVVTLSGAVETQAAKDRAIQLARETDGVSRVEDRLTVNPSLTLDNRVEGATADAADRAEGTAGSASDKLGSSAQSASDKAGDAAEKIGEAAKATGAAAPSMPAMSEGRRKIPPPTVTFTMPAASIQVPSARTSDDSEAGRAEGVVTVAGKVLRQ